MHEDLKKYIQEGLKKLDYPLVDFVVELPKDISNGDFSTNVALLLSKELHKNPKEIADSLVAGWATNLHPNLSKIETAGPGFINFYLSKEYIEKEIAKPLSNIKSEYTDKNIIVEYIDPNPFKQFHIGHLMAATIGESISRLYEIGGAQVTRMCYQGDIGPHVAKCIWGMIQNKETFPHDQDSIEDKIKYLSDSYVYGARQYKEDLEIQTEIKEINKKLFEKSDMELQIYYDKGRAWSLEGFEIMYKILGTKFDYHVFETQTSQIGKKIVEENLGTIFKKSDESEAIIYEGEQDGLHTRVFINSQGLPTYEAKDLGLAVFKSEMKDFTRSVVITGLEQTEYFKVMLSALSKIKPQEALKTTHISHGLMLGIDGKKMSSRDGALLASDLIHDIENKIREKILEREYSDDIKNQIIHTVSIAALKYSILRQTPGKNIIFDFEKSISFEGDSGPYIQYAYTRAQSVLQKAGKIDMYAQNLKQISLLEKQLIRFDSVVTRAIEDLAPQIVANYLVELASEFNSWYTQEKILGDENEAYKLLITHKAKETLKTGLNLLGIEVPEKM